MTKAQKLVCLKQMRVSGPNLLEMLLYTKIVKPALNWEQSGLLY